MDKLTTKSGLKITVSRGEEKDAEKLLFFTKTALANSYLFVTNSNEFNYTIVK